LQDRPERNLGLPLGSLAGDPTDCPPGRGADEGGGDNQGVGGQGGASDPGGDTNDLGFGGDQTGNSGDGSGSTPTVLRGPGSNQTSMSPDEDSSAPIQPAGFTPSPNLPPCSGPNSDYAKTPGLGRGKGALSDPLNPGKFLCPDCFGKTYGPPTDEDWDR